MLAIFRSNRLGASVLPLTQHLHSTAIFPFEHAAQACLSRALLRRRPNDKPIPLCWGRTAHFHNRDQRPGFWNLQVERRYEQLRDRSFSFARTSGWPENADHSLSIVSGV